MNTFHFTEELEDNDWRRGVLKRTDRFPRSCRLLETNFELNFEIKDR
jgi:hypothetical protein